MRSITLAAIVFSGAGCSFLVDFDSLTENAGVSGAGASSGDGGDGAQAAGATGGGNAGGGGGSIGGPCAPVGATEDCYEGAEGTLGVGLCVGGEKTCTKDGWSDCEGQVVPMTETCLTAGDDDCDGSTMCSPVPLVTKPQAQAGEIIALAHDAQSYRYAIAEHTDGKRYLDKFNTSGDLVGSPLVVPDDAAFALGAVALAVDSAGAVWVAGCFSGTHDFGAGEETSVGTADLFIAKYLSGTGYLWAETWGGAGAIVCANAITVAEGGDLLFAGAQNGTVNWGGEIGTDAGQGIIAGRVTSELPEIQWKKRWTASSASVRSVALGKSGRLSISGVFRDSANFEGAGTLTAPNSDSTGFLARVNGTTGIADIAKLFPPAELQPAPQGHIMAAFAFSSVTLDTTLVTAAAGKDVAVARLDSDALLKPVAWTVVSGSGGTRDVMDLTVDATGGVFVAGKFTQELTLDGVPSAVPAVGAADGFIVGMNASLVPKTLLTAGASGAPAPGLILHSLGAELLVGANLEDAMDLGGGVIGPGAFLIDYPGL